VPNWSISRNYKNIWNSTKDSVTKGMFVTRRPRGGQTTIQRAQGPAGRPHFESVQAETHVEAKPQFKGPKVRPTDPNPWPADHTLSQFRLRLGGYVHMLVHKSILCPRVGENLEEWSVGHMDGRPVVHHLQTDSIKSVEAPLYPYIRILTVEFTHVTLFL
jgi:hypothetical protein